MYCVEFDLMRSCWATFASTRTSCNEKIPVGFFFNHARVLAPILSSLVLISLRAFSTSSHEIEINHQQCKKTPFKEFEKA